MADSSIRLQNIALEHAELIARRQMTWSEATNRAAMFMTVLGAAVVGIALIAQTVTVGSDVVFVALLVLSVVLLIGLTSFGRIAALDMDDMRWVQGLNRLRHLRLELDKGMAPYLVTSPHDDFDSVLEAYGPENASNINAFFTLSALMIFLNAALSGVVAALIALQLGWSGTIPIVVGAAVAVLVVLALGVWMFRGAVAVSTRFRSVVPAAVARPGVGSVETGTLPPTPDDP